MPNFCGIFGPGGGAGGGGGWGLVAAKISGCWTFSLAGLHGFWSDWTASIELRVMIEYEWQCDACDVSIMAKASATGPDGSFLLPLLHRAGN